MIVTTFRIPYRYGETVKIKPIFDVHLGNRYCDVKSFKSFLADSDESTYFFGGGDFLDSIITRDAKRYVKHADDTVGDAIIDEQVDRGYELLKPYKDRIIGWGRGNHEQTILKHCGTDPAGRLAERLGCTYLGYSGLVRLLLTEDGGRGRMVVIRWHHGWGGGSRTLGADLTKYSKDIAYWDSDIYLYGHVHKKQNDEIPRMGLVGERLVAKPKTIAICGTFLKTYTNTTDSTYAEEMGYPPVAVGGHTINIRPLQKKWCEIGVDT